MVLVEISLIVLFALLTACIVLIMRLHAKAEAQEQKTVKLAMRVADLIEQVRAIDDSTGIHLHELELEYETFKKLYGEAAIEREREAAKAERAFSEGVQNIMAYGQAQFGNPENGRGGAK